MPKKKTRKKSNMSPEIIKKLEDLNLKDLIGWMRLKFPKFLEYENEILASKINSSTPDIRYDYIKNIKTDGLTDIQLSQLALDAYLSKWHGSEIGKI